jgi:hypothetical protein
MSPGRTVPAKQDGEQPPVEGHPDDTTEEE